VSTAEVAKGDAAEIDQVSRRARRVVMDAGRLVDEVDWSGVGDAGGRQQRERDQGGAQAKELRHRRMERRLCDGPVDAPTGKARPSGGALRHD
jgi:hypothetical protein